MAQQGKKGVVLLDGGTGLALVKEGHSFINENPLWSASMVRTHPEDLVKLHKEFFLAGASIVVTATYQASVGAFVKHYGISEAEAVVLVQDSVKLALKARDEAAIETGRRGYVAASIGPLGATLCDMSEYHGRYADAMTRQELSLWHLERMKVIVDAKPDLLAIETIPVVKEAEAILDNLSHFPGMKAYVTFQCKDGQHTAHGEHIRHAIETVASNANVVAVGVNCGHPHDVTSLVRIMAAMSLDKPIIVKPNGKSPTQPGQKIEDIKDYVDEWLSEGASWIGGCCYVYPEDIAALHSHLSDNKHFQLTDPGNLID